ERGITFSAVGTCGQRCTSLRCIIVHGSVYDRLVPRLAAIYGRLPIGSPLDDGTLVGPLVDRAAFDGMQAALAQAKKDGGTVHGGARALADRFPDAWYVAPALVEMPSQTAIVA